LLVAQIQKKKTKKTTMSKFGRKIKQAPAGYEDIEPTITALENELRESKLKVDEIDCIYFLILPLLGVNEPHEGLRKNEALWPIHQINWQKSRYVYDMYYTFNRISREVYDYCVNNKIVDPALIAKWKKPGYERLCSTYVINPRNYKFGTVSICRVPKQFLAADTEIEDPVTGCHGCASGNNHNIFGNKYGQYLAAIQVAREERAAKKAAAREALEQAKAKKETNEDDDEEDEDEESSEEESGDSDKNDEDNDNDDNKSEDSGPVTEIDGTSRKKQPTLWARNAKEELMELTEDMIGRLAPEARSEALAAASKAGNMKKHGHEDKETAASNSSGPPNKRVRPN
jgi:bud site selection protein 31